MSQTGRHEEAKQSGWGPKGRRFFNVSLGLISTIAAVWTLMLVYQRVSLPNPSPVSVLEKAVTAFWALGPPVFFWLDWVMFAGRMEDDEREIAKHTHDLARNIWLGLLAILIYALFGKAEAGG
jgi:hypothetical protein